MKPLLRSVWMHPWDLEGRPPDETLDFLEDHGLNACHLAVCYHGGRMVLGRHIWRRVMDHGVGACYLPLDASRFPDPALCPPVEDYSAVIGAFLEAAARRGFPVHAWVVLNHRDFCPPEARRFLTRNVYGDIYAYSLCPAHEEVRETFAELCRQVGRFGGFSGLELEGIGLLGYQHNSLHDKTGLDLPPSLRALLSICVCEACRDRVGSATAAETKAAIDAFFRSEPLRTAATPPHVIEHRRQTQAATIESIRARTSLPLCLRTSADPSFTGGKSSLTLAEAEALVSSASLTFFGSSLDGIEQALRALPLQPRSMPLYGGFVFHGPDCRSPEDVRRRTEILDSFGMDGQIYYCYGMATETQWRWLKSAIGR